MYESRVMKSVKIAMKGGRRVKKRDGGEFDQSILHAYI